MQKNTVHTCSSPRGGAPGAVVTSHTPTNRTTKRVSRPRLRSQVHTGLQLLGARSSIALVAIARRPSPARPRRLQLLARRPPLAAGLIGSGCMHPRPPPASKSPASKSSAVRCPAAPPIVPRCPCLLPPTARPAARHRRAFCAYSREELVNALPHLRTRADAGGARTVEACQG